MNASPLQLEDYFIEELSMQVNHAFDEETDMLDGDISVEPQHLVRSDDTGHHQVAMTVAYAPREGAEEKLPYSIRVSGRAFFRLDDSGLTKAERGKTVILNGSSILFGLLRAEVAHVTSLGRWGRILLPTVNLIDAFREMAERQQQARPAQDEPGEEANL
ncbi:MAG: hypothetical protein ACYCX3_15345 [Thermoleophilia bacterium]